MSSSAAILAEGKICDAADLAAATDSNNSLMVCLTRGQSIGLTLDAEAGFISLITVIFVFVLIFRKAWRTGKLVQRPTDVFMIALFTFEIFMSLGRITHIRWIQEGKLYVGEYCTAQGIIQQLGETGVALVTLAIAVHTLIAVMWSKLLDQLAFAYTVVGLICLFLILFIGISVPLHTHGDVHYMAPAEGYWCWIAYGGNDVKWKLTAEYLWLWLALFISVIAYIPLFFWARGNLSVSQERWWKFKIKRVHDIKGIDADGRKRRALSMIAYPIAYSLTLLPNTILRFHTFANNDKLPPSAATLSLHFLYSLSGAVNACLFIFTRSDLLLPGETARKRGALGIAPGITLSGEAKHYSVASDADSIKSELGPRLRARGEEPAPLGFLPTPSDGGWNVAEEA